MSKVLISCVMLGLLLGCEPAQEARDTVEDGAKKTIEQIDRSKALSDLTLLTAEIQTYHLENSKYPAKLSDLDLKAVHYPDDLEYNPETGEVRSKSFPNL